MANQTAAAISAVLEPGETLIWSGEPDRDVMLKTMGKRKSLPFGNILFFGIIGGVLWLSREQLSDMAGTGLVVSPNLLAVVAFTVAFIWLIQYLKRRQAQGHVGTLNYAITDRRVLIVHKGEIYQSVTPENMRWVELTDRLGAEGYYDIIWDRKPIPHSTERTPSPTDIERSRVGFKALRDGPAVMERLEAWRSGHAGRADETAAAALAALQSEQDVPRLEHPRLGFSLPTPPGWEVTVRNKKVIWGKTGLDLTADKWLSPESTSDWNVIRVRNVAANSEVMLEVAETEPVATFESMSDPKVPGFVKKVMQIELAEEHVSLNGLEGFRIDVSLSGMGQTQMAIGQSSDKVQGLMRQYVLHDGLYQYYLVGTWPKGNATQEATCQAIMEGIRGCPSFDA